MDVAWFAHGVRSERSKANTPNEVDVDGVGAGSEVDDEVDDGEVRSRWCRRWKRSR